jgi:bacterial/archaeal transporter family-2 protein
MSQLLGMAGMTALAVCAGISFVLQQAVNADLKVSLGSAAWAGFVSYLGGTICMLLLAVVLRDAVPSTSFIARSNWWMWTGGFFGAVYIAISILLVPRLGAATFIAMLVAGQMLCSLVIDHYGLFGVMTHRRALHGSLARRCWLSALSSFGTNVFSRSAQAARGRSAASRARRRVPEDRYRTPQDCRPTRHGRRRG